MSPLLQIIYYFLSFIIGMVIGGIIVYLLYKKQIKTFQKQFEMANKEQIKNMLSVFGKKPSEEQVNRIVQSMKKEPKKPKRKK